MEFPPVMLLCEAISKVTHWISKFEAEAERKRMGKKAKQDKFLYPISVPCSVFHLDLVSDFVQTFSTDTDYVFRIVENLWANMAWLNRFEPQNYREVNDKVVTFLQDLKEVFRMPKLHQPGDNVTTVLLTAAFIEFFLRLLQAEAHGMPDFRGDPVVKELRFLYVMLWDAPFWAGEIEQVRRVLARLEEVVNDAGKFVHALIFCSNGATDGALLHQHISLFKDDITEFLNSLPNLIVPKIKFDVSDSYFIVDSLLHDLDGLMRGDVDSPIVEVKDQIERLHASMGHLDTKESKEIMMRMRHTAYEAEYVINSFLVGHVPVWYLIIRLTSVTRNVELIGTRLQEMMTNHDLRVIKLVDNFHECLALQSRKDFEVDDVIVGFEDEERVLDQLVGGKQNLQIISIVGMPGLGKTTLARKLYNHPQSRNRFDKSAWCVVSQWYQRKSMLFNILIGLETEVEEATILNMDEESMCELICKTLKGLRYLIVLDDVWSSSVWEDVQRHFPDKGNGSRILLTSRNKDVAPSGSTIHELPLFKNDQCWELLEKKVFGNKPCPPPLQGIGKKIAANCKGLPLAVVVTAGILLAMRKEPTTWGDVEQTLDTYILPEQYNSMMQILKLSYKHLPPHLKPCFLYFGVFHLNVEVNVKKLIRLWIAEGFICKEEGKSKESTAEEYLLELIDRSLVMVAKRRQDGSPKVCIMHDLLLEMCLTISKEENFLIIVSDHSVYNQKCRRLFCQSSVRRLQLYGPFTSSFFCACFPPHESINLENLKLLRVLECRAGWASNSESSAVACAPFDLMGFEHLLNLRYLATECMLASFGSYTNLEFLTVSSVVHLSLILKMPKLRYLKATRVYVDNDYNPSQANSLEYLSKFCVMKKKDELVLEHSPNLRKLKLQYDKYSVWHRCPSNLSFLTQLELLKVYTSNKTWRIDITFPPNVKELRLSGLPLSEKKTEFPSSVRKLDVVGLCWDWNHMSAFGMLPNLEVLKLGYNAFMDRRWDTSDDEFQCLKILELIKLDLAQWNVSSSEHFPSLQWLILDSCWNLREIPLEMGYASKLQGIEVRGLCYKSVIQSAMKIEQQQKDAGNEDFAVIIQNIQYRDDFSALLLPL